MGSDSPWNQSARRNDDGLLFSDFVGELGLELSSLFSPLKVDRKDHFSLVGDSGGECGGDRSKLISVVEKTDAGTMVGLDRSESSAKGKRAANGGFPRVGEVDVRVRL